MISQYDRESFVCSVRCTLLDGLEDVFEYITDERVIAEQFETSEISRWKEQILERIFADVEMGICDLFFNNDYENKGGIDS